MDMRDSLIREVTSSRNPKRPLKDTSSKMPSGCWNQSPQIASMWLLGLKIPLQKIVRIQRLRLWEDTEAPSTSSLKDGIKAADGFTWASWNCCQGIYIVDGCSQGFCVRICQ